MSTFTAQTTDRILVGKKTKQVPHFKTGWEWKSTNETPRLHQARTNAQAENSFLTCSIGIVKIPPPPFSPLLLRRENES